MPKNSKTDQTNGSAPEGASSSSSVETTSEPKKRVKTTKTAAKKTAAKKATATTRAKKTTAPKPAKKKSSSYEPSAEDIRLRAYFIAERRAQTSMGGDSAQDWLDARQQLIDEYGERGS